jgi:hypothetical protein
LKPPWHLLNQIHEAIKGLNEATPQLRWEIFQSILDNIISKLVLDESREVLWDGDLLQKEILNIHIA